MRWWLASREPLPEHWLDALSVVDVGIVLSVIWSYQFAFNHPAGGVLKAPAFVLLLLLVGVRALRFHPRPVVVAGIAAVAGLELADLLRRLHRRRCRGDERLPLLSVLVPHPARR